MMTWPAPLDAITGKMSALVMKKPKPVHKTLCEEYRRLVSEAGNGERTYRRSSGRMDTHISEPRGSMSRILGIQ